MPNSAKFTVMHFLARTVAYGVPAAWFCVGLYCFRMDIFRYLGFMALIWVGASFLFTINALIGPGGGGDPELERLGFWRVWLRTQVVMLIICGVSGSFIGIPMLFAWITGGLQ